MALFLPSLTDDIVGIGITPKALTCSWINRARHKKTPYELKAYKQVIFESPQKTSLILFNPTRVKALITSFMQLHSITNAGVVFALSGDELTEKQVMIKKPAANLSVIEGEDHRLWHYYCLQEDSPGQSPWYCCSITPELLFQYQLLAIRSDLNLLQITTPTMALLKAYAFLKQHAQQGTKTSIIDYLGLNGYLTIKSPHDHAALVESFGLFLLGRSLHEKH